MNSDNSDGKALDSFLAGMFREDPPIFTGVEAQLPRLTLPNQTSIDEPELKAALMEAPSNVEHVPTMAERAKAVLAGLNRDTAIRLRWALRDIKGKRTKLSPVDPNDLAALIDLKFVEMHEGTPTLTEVGQCALD
jgi:hypothetical protein